MLRAGDMLGPYEIRSPLGAGGMGEVYRAHDKRLRRDVAIKVLNAEHLMGETNRRRFIQEAQAASALNHPNIVAVFDVNLEGDLPYIVSELVEGESLHALIGGRPMPVRKLVDLAVQIADGLSAAHQAGLAHRDLKPTNILVARDGRAKIVDFGLALQLSMGPPGEDAATAPMTLTQEGRAVGTAYYMSPEQARGQTVDLRSDVFSFGVVLYEMAAGKRPFSGNSKVETLAAIINQDAPPIETPVPPPLFWVIDRCLAKEPANRYQSTIDLFHDLRQLRDRSGELLSVSISGVRTQTQVTRRRWPLIAAIGAAGLIGLVAGLLLVPDPVPITAAQFRPLATGAEYEDNAAWSPDGTSIAYQAEVDGIFQIFTKSLDSSAALQVTHCPDACTSPAWFPDGARLFVLMKQSIWSIGAAGGEMNRVIQGASRFALSRRGDVLAFVRQEFDPPRASIWLSSPPGTAPVRYTPGPFEASYFNGARVAFAPDGQLLLYASMAGTDRGSEFWILPKPGKSGGPHLVLPSLRSAWPVQGLSWMPDSRRVVVAVASQPDSSRSHLYVADTRSGAVRPLVVGIGSESAPDVSRDGQKMAYSALESDTDIAEIALDGSGVKELIASSRLERNPAWSPRGRQLVYVTDRNGPDEIWITTMERGWDKPLVTPRNFRDGAAKPIDTPVFSPDGLRIAFERGARIWVVSAAGGTPVQIGSFGTMDLAPTWSPDGSWIAFQAKDRGLMKVRVGTQEPPVLLYRDSRRTDCVPEWSPTGDSIAYCTDQGTALISPDNQPLRILRQPSLQAMGWSADGATLYGLTSENSRQSIVAIDVKTRRERPIIQLEKRYRIDDLRSSTLRLSLSPDGKSAAVTMSRSGSDIWMLERFDPSPWPFALWRSQK